MSRPVPRAARDIRARYRVSGNVVWLTCAGSHRDSRHLEPIAGLKRSIEQLIHEIERSARIKADIAAAVDARRYELYGRSASLGERCSQRKLAEAQRAHLVRLLRIVHAIAAAGSDVRADSREPASRLHPLASSIRELGTRLERARQLSQSMLAHCQQRDGQASQRSAGAALLPGET